MSFAKTNLTTGLILLGFFPTVFASAAPKIFQCNGYYKSFKCTNTLKINTCKNAIEMHWPALRLPGSPEWAKKNRNWCTVVFDGEEAKETRKYPPEKCDRMLALLSAALQGFPAIPWQDAQCTHHGGADGILYVSQRWEKPEPAKNRKFEVETLPVAPKDPEPQAVGLEEVRACRLHINLKNRLKGQRYVLRCPVIPQRELSWLKKYLAVLDAGLVISNLER